ncbi:hypothetical protein QBC47DRAFT_440575 [Echria macrotheca]|uniref:RNase H type-1 domain-containing protein n=1 Tax=Echria macrotheca TaxID=438768 RepID=A0AAJ0BHJ8_9PEZI|nr:hypothetical protein QBC47DRAFT_440575 [Echria macrotheca]
MSEFKCVRKSDLLLSSPNISGVFRMFTNVEIFRSKVKPGDPAAARSTSRNVGLVARFPKSARKKSTRGKSARGKSARGKSARGKSTKALNKDAGGHGDNGQNLDIEGDGRAEHGPSFTSDPPICTEWYLENALERGFFVPEFQFFRNFEFSILNPDAARHAAIRASKEFPFIGDDLNLVLFTDGSWDSAESAQEYEPTGTGGFAIAFKNPGPGVRTGAEEAFGWKMSKAIDVNQTELMGITEAVSRASTIIADHSQRGVDVYRKTVRIFTDSQHCIRELKELAGRWMYDREETRLHSFMHPIFDSLARLADKLAEKDVRIHISWAPRNQTPLHCLADEHAGRAHSDKSYRETEKSQATASLESDCWKLYYVPPLAQIIDWEQRVWCKLRELERLDDMRINHPDEMSAGDMSRYEELAVELSDIYTPMSE